jgi:hypothetical protein
VTDTTPAPRSNDPANDGYEIRLAEEARREKEEKARDEVDDEVPAEDDVQLATRAIPPVE